MAPRPLLAPIVAKLRRRPTEDWGTHAANAARQAVFHGPWTQEELYKIGKASTPLCQACGREPGTAHHRYYKCCKAVAHRLEAPRKWQHVAEQEPHSLTWTRGLIRHPAADWAFQPVGEHVHWHAAPQLGGSLGAHGAALEPPGGGAEGPRGS